VDSAFILEGVVRTRERAQMKKVTLLLPDKILYTIGTSNGPQTKALGTDRENIIEALEGNDYHVNYYFPNGSVEVVSVQGF